jgi:hypothetical protein
MRSHAQSLFDAVAIFHLTAEDRMRGTEESDSDEPAMTPVASPAPRATPPKPVATRASPPARKHLAIVGGDDWEEF